MEKVDYLIVGQGIAGSLLAIELINAGCQVMVLNEEKANTSSLKAGGLYNPITGRKMVKTWMADELFPVIESYYENLERSLGCKFLYPRTIYRPFYSYEEQNDWSVKAEESAYRSFVKTMVADSQKIAGIQDPFGGLMLDQCGYVNLPELLLGAKKWLQSKGAYKAELFQYSQMTIINDGAVYKDLMVQKVIFCDGPDAAQNPFWSELPFKLVKGEILQIDATLPEDLIVNRGVFIIPKNGHFSVGSTYDHSHLDHVPSAEGIKNLKDRLSKLYQGDYQVISATAGVRPATHDRRPFIGLKPAQPQIGIFNGFGTKGVSLVPYFATQFVNYLSGSGELIPEVNVTRVIK